MVLVKQPLLDFSFPLSYTPLMQNDIHEVQGSILRELLFHNGTNFASLNKLDLTNDHFTFHIKDF